MEKNNVLKEIEGPAPIAEKLVILDTSDLYAARVAKEDPTLPAKLHHKIIPIPAEVVSGQKVKFRCWDEALDAVLLDVTNRRPVQKRCSSRNQ